MESLGEPDQGSATGGQQQLEEDMAASDTLVGGTESTSDTATASNAGAASSEETVDDFSTIKILQAANFEDPRPFMVWILKCVILF